MGRRPRPAGPFHVVTTRRQGAQREYVAHLLRRSFREGGRVKKETVANLSHLPDEVIELIRRALRGESFLAAGEELQVQRSLPAGHVQAVLAMARRLELARLPAWAAGLLARWQARHAADRLRADVQCRGLPGRGGGV